MFDVYNSNDANFYYSTYSNRNSSKRFAFPFPTHSYHLSLSLEMREEYGCHRSTSCLTEKTPRTNQRTRIQTTGESSQVNPIDLHSFLSHILFHRMRNEFTSKQHQTELINFNEYSARRQKELGKRHAFNQKQFPKNIKVNIIFSSFFSSHSPGSSDETSGYQTSV